MTFEKNKASWKRNNLIQNILIHSLTSLTCVLLCYYGFRPPPLISSSAECFKFVSIPRWKPLLLNAKTLFLVANLIVVFLVGGSRFRRASKGNSSSPIDDLYDEYVERSKRLRGIQVNGVEESNGKEEKEEQVGEVPPGPAEDEDDRKSGGGLENNELPTGEQTMSVAEDLQDPKSDEGIESDGGADEEEKEEREGDAMPGPAKEEDDQVSGGGVENNELPTGELARSAAEDLQDPKSDEGSESNELSAEELTRRVEEFIARVNKRRWMESRTIILPRI